MHDCTSCTDQVLVMHRRPALYVYVSLIEGRYRGGMKGPKIKRASSYTIGGGRYGGPVCMSASLLYCFSTLQGGAPFAPPSALPGLGQYSWEANIHWCRMTVVRGRDDGVMRRQTQACY